MIKKLIKAPVNAAAFVAAKVMGRNTAPAAEPPPPVRKAPPPPRPAAAKPAPGPGAGHDHDHGHDHGHSHDHGGGAATRQVTVTAEDTPNPNARKFVCSVKVVEQGSLSFANATEAQKHPVGKAVFAVGGVKGVFAVNDFVTVTKNDDQDWASLTPRLTKAISRALENA